MKIPNESHLREKYLVLIKRVRQEKGLRQAELAEKLAVPQSFVSKYESGDRQLNILELRHVCGVIGISLEDFVRQLEKTLNETK